MYTKEGQLVSLLDQVIFVVLGRCREIDLRRYEIVSTSVGM